MSREPGSTIISRLRQPGYPLALEDPWLSALRLLGVWLFRSESFNFQLSREQNGCQEERPLRRQTVCPSHIEYVPAKIRKFIEFLGRIFPLETPIAGGCGRKSLSIWKSIHRILLLREITDWKIAGYENPKYLVNQSGPSRIEYCSPKLPHCFFCQHQV